MKTRIRRFWLPLAMLAVLVSWSLFAARTGRGVSSVIALFCTATDYEPGPQRDVLTICTDSEPGYTLRVSVTDPALRQKLAETELQTIIGVQMALEIPPEVVRKQHLDPENFPMFDQLATGWWDEYLTLQDVFCR